MKVAHHTRYVFADRPSWFSSGYIIASPFDHVAEAQFASSAAAVGKGIDDLLDLEMLEPVDFDRRQGCLSLSSVWISSGRGEQIDIEDMMDFHRCG